VSHTATLQLVRDAHINSGHHGRDVMRLALAPYKIYCKEKTIDTFRVCDNCESFKSFRPTEEEFHPIITKYPMNRLHIDVTYPPELKKKGTRNSYHAYVAVGGKC
jgi:hypothetical protein